MTKQELRKTLRAARRDHVGSLPDTVRGLVFHRPPAPMLELVPRDAVIGLYAATGHEAPTAAYARFFFEQGHRLALPRFASREAPMHFASHGDPFESSDLEPGPLGLLQPSADAAEILPDVVFVPLLGFTAEGGRLGQGGGHYDRWLAAHPGTQAIGLAWDCQLLGSLPLEAHDRPLSAVVTPTRFFERTAA